MVRNEIGQESWAFLWGFLPSKIIEKTRGMYTLKGRKRKNAKKLPQNDSVFEKNYPVCFHKDRSISFVFFQTSSKISSQNSSKNNISQVTQIFIIS